MGFKRYSQYQIASAIICHSEKEAHIYIEAADSSSSVEQPMLLNLAILA